MTRPLLDVEHVTMRFGGLFAVNDLSFSAEARAITAIIGPNGAGKTTLFNCITGFYKPQSHRPERRRRSVCWNAWTTMTSSPGQGGPTFQNIRRSPA